MTTIEKLQIQGIRSFAPSNSKNVIEFYKPLTIIVGHNGAGKTVLLLEKRRRGEKKRADFGFLSLISTADSHRVFEVCLYRRVPPKHKQWASFYS
jgi:AAA domain